MASLVFVVNGAVAPMSASAKRHKVGCKKFPVWDTAKDRLAGSRVVAQDSVVFVARRPRVAPTEVGTDGAARRIVVPRRGLAGRFAAGLYRPTPPTASGSG